MDLEKEFPVAKLQLVAKLGNYLRRVKRRKLDTDALLCDVGVRIRRSVVEKEAENEITKELDTLKFRIKRQRNRVKKEIMKAEKEEVESVSVKPIKKNKNDEKTRKIKDVGKGDVIVETEKPKLQKKQLVVDKEEADNKEDERWEELYTEFKDKLESTYSVMFNPLDSKEKVLCSFLKRIKRLWKIGKFEKTNEYVKDLIDEYSFHSRKKVSFAEILVIIESLLKNN